MTGATIIFGPRIEDRVYEKISADWISTANLAGKFPDIHIATIRERLRYLSRNGKIESRKDEQSPYQEYFWRRA